MDLLRLDGNKYDKNNLEKIMKTSNFFLRCGKADQAQKFFSDTNLSALPVVLGGGVPHFDFEIYEQLQSKKLVKGDNYNMLDYMKTLEYNDFTSSYTNFQQKSRFHGSIGNPNW